MSGLTFLFRSSPFLTPILRKKRSGINMLKRKQIRRVRKLNTFSRQYTGQQNQHGWFTPKRYKALGLFIEATRNVHPGTLPIKPDLKKQITQKFTQDSHWHYYNFRNYISQFIVQEQRKKHAISESQISNLPAHFREAILAQQQEISMPKIVNPLFIHNAQYNLFMPMEQRHRINLLLKIENPPQNKDEQNQKQQKESLKQKQQQ